jgi:hypothetical protein
MKISKAKYNNKNALVNNDFLLFNNKINPTIAVVKIIGSYFNKPII